MTKTNNKNNDNTINHSFHCGSGGEGMEGKGMNPYKYLNSGIYTCPHCKKQFEAEYPSKTILGDWKHNAQLAYSNFKRHLESHETRNKFRT